MSKNGSRLEQQPNLTVVAPQRRHQIQQIARQRLVVPIRPLQHLTEFKKRVVCQRQDVRFAANNDRGREGIAPRLT